MAEVERLQAVVKAVSAAGQAALFTHNLEQLRSMELKLRHAGTLPGMPGEGVEHRAQQGA